MGDWSQLRKSITVEVGIKEMTWNNIENITVDNTVYPVTFDDNVATISIGTL